MLFCGKNAFNDSDGLFDIEHLDYLIEKLCADNVSEMDSDASSCSSTSMEIAELTCDSTQKPPNQKENANNQDNTRESGSSSSDESEVNLPAGICRNFYLNFLLWNGSSSWKTVILI